MNRRQFLYRSSFALCGLNLRPPLATLLAQGSPRVDGRRLNANLEQLGKFGRTATGGIDRVAFSQADLEAREFVKGLMRAAQLDVTVDAAGNIIGLRVGNTRGAPLMLGSHIDSVPQGGNYDGPVGTLAAIEVAQTLADHDIILDHPLEVVVFINEEGGKTGSRAMSGEVAPNELDLPTRSGHTIGEGIAIVGGDPAALDSVRRQPGSIAAYLELHVEQGMLLEKEGVDIGVVEGIVGIKRWRVTINGFANHAGTTPMEDRRNALLAAAGFIEIVNRVVTTVEGSQVGTVGQLEVSPGAANVIPGRVTLSLEIRDLEMQNIDAVFRDIEIESQHVAKATRTAFAFEQYYVSRAAPTAESIRETIDDVAADLGYSNVRMPSGAGEFTRPDDIVNGANVLLNALLELDKDPPQ